MILIGCYEGTSLISRIIRWETRSEISHISVLQIPDEAWDDQRQTIIWGVMQPALSTCSLWEAWGRDGIVKRTGVHNGHTPGTHIRLMRLKDAYNKQLNEAAVVAFLNSKVGLKYDWFGIVRFALRMNCDQPGRWFCSELTHAALKAGGVLLQDRVTAYWVAPGDIYRSPSLENFLITETKAKSSEKGVA